MQDFRELKAWQKSHELTLRVYRATRTLPKEELYGLTSQLRRAAASVAANLAEGCCRASDRDFARFVAIALGSTSECEYHALLARDLQFLDEAVYSDLAKRVQEVKRMLSALYQRLSPPNT
jgi:four helix bundle protein